MEFDRYTLVLLAVGIPFTLRLLSDWDQPLSRFRIAAVLVWLGFGSTVHLLSRTGTNQRSEF